MVETMIHYRDPNFYSKICLKWQKVGSEDDKGFQQFLNTVQYKARSILCYERVFGPGYVSPGRRNRSTGILSTEFAAYIKQRGYDLHDVQAYGKMLKDAGFNEVVAEDRTHQFMKVQEKELGAVMNEKERFISDFSESDNISGNYQNKFIFVDASFSVLEIPSESIDLIFANSVFVNLSYNEVETMVPRARMAQWLKP